MGTKRKRLTVDLPEKAMTELKLLTILHQKPMREVVIDAIELLAKHPSYDQTIKSLKHKVYRLEYDKSS